MIIGIPKERKTLENRVALTPSGAKELVKRNHKVLLESGAGLGAHFSDNEYFSAGCEIINSLEEVWKRSELLVKVKEPHEEEYKFFREGLVVFDYLHLAGLPEVAKQLVAKKVTGIAYELVSYDGRLFPLLEPMSEVAGKLSVINGANHLLSHHGGRGLLLGGVVGVLPANVLIIGAGIAGRAACQAALGLGANVTLLDINQKQLEIAKNIYGNSLSTCISNEETLKDLAKNTDLLIGAVLVPGDKAPRVISQEIKSLMPKGSVIVDISIDQGGCVDGIRSTSLKEPTYVENNVIHYAVPNMPAQVARTSTLALTSATLPYIIELAEMGSCENIVKQIKTNNPNKPKHAALSQALCTHDGGIVNEVIRRSVGG